MKAKILIIGICIVVSVVNLFSQTITDDKFRRGDATLLTIGRHTGNRVGLTFYNDGQIGGINTGVDIRGEWPIGSGNFYIGDMIPMIGVEFLNTLGDTLHAVDISRGPRKDQGDKRHPVQNYFWGFNPLPGYINPSQNVKNDKKSLAMSHLSYTWPTEGWGDHPDWKDKDGKTQWNGYFGRGIQNADQESFFKADDNSFDKFNSNFLADSSDTTRKGMALLMTVRGFQWSSFLAQDVLFWLYDIKNIGKYIYRKSTFGTVIGACIGGDGDCGDDLADFKPDEFITYTWDNSMTGNRGQKVGYSAYAYLESPGNPFDGIDNDGDSPDPNSPLFVKADFNEVIYQAGDKIVLINPTTYERSLYTVKSTKDTVYSLGVRFVIDPGVTKFREGNIDRIENGIAIPSKTAYDGVDNDLDGLIDENESIHLNARVLKGYQPLKYKNYITGAGVTDLLIDERRDDGAGQMVLSWIKTKDGQIKQTLHWSGDENGDWDVNTDDVGSDGLGPGDDGYPGPDKDGTEGNGIPDQGEPRFGKTDPDESDQIGLTSFNFFSQPASPSMKDDELLWSRMLPGRFDVTSPQPQDGDFIYSSGYFPLVPNTSERFSIAVFMGEDLQTILDNKAIVQQIYNAGYKFPQPPKKPRVKLAQENGKVVIYWDGKISEESIDFITKKKDFQGYKIYRATDASFTEAKLVTDAFGVLKFDKPYMQNDTLAQFDLVDTIKGYFYPTPELQNHLRGVTFWLGRNSGLVHKYVDSNVVLGQTYYYAVCAYDRGEREINVFPTENSKFVFITNTGEILTDVNTGYITPGARPVGFTKGNVDELKKSTGFRGTGVAQIEIVDEASIRNDFKYQIVFSDTALQGYTKDWSLLDLQTPDTVYLKGQTNPVIVKPLETIDITKGDTIIINGKKFIADTNKYTAPYDSLVARDTVFNGETPIVHGFRVHLFNDNRIVNDTLKTKFSDTTTKKPKIIFKTFFWASSGPGTAYNGVLVPYDYRVEFFNTNIGNSVADTLFPNIPSNRIPSVPINFKVKNLTTDKYVDVVMFKPSQLASTRYNIWFKENLDGKIQRTWQLLVDYDSLNAPLETNGFLDLFTLKPFSKNDNFTFTMKAAKINSENAKNNLDKIKVVPNPYVVTHEAEAKLLSSQTSGRGEREVRFTHVPPNAKISIFTVRGELIKTLKQENLFVGDVYWNLRTEENLDVAFGVYVFVVEVPDIGTKIGKLALIK